MLLKDFLEGTQNPPFHFPVIGRGGGGVGNYVLTSSLDYIIMSPSSSFYCVIIEYQVIVYYLRFTDTLRVHRSKGRNLCIWTRSYSKADFAVSAAS